MKVNLFFTSLLILFFSHALAKEKFEPISEIVMNVNEINDIKQVENVLNRFIAVNFFIFKSRFSNDTELEEQSILMARKYFGMMKNHIESQGIVFDKTFVDREEFNPTYVYYNLKNELKNDKPKFIKLIQNDALTCAFYLQILGDISQGKAGSS